MRKIASTITRKDMIAVAAGLALAALALAIPKMASGQEATEMWFIKGIVTIKDEAPQETRFLIADNNGKPVLLTFQSKDQCEGASKNDPDIAGPLALFKEAVVGRGGVLVVSCERFVHPAVPPKGEQI